MDASLNKVTDTSTRHFRFFDFMLAATCILIVCSNIIGAGKVAEIAGFTFGAGVIFFPLSYVLGDVLTEVYGYQRARRAIWAGFFAAAFAAFMALKIYFFGTAMRVLLAFFRKSTSPKDWFRLLLQIPFLWKEIVWFEE